LAEPGQPKHRTRRIIAFDRQSHGGKSKR
jgi:hypothetical protein